MAVSRIICDYSLDYNESSVMSKSIVMLRTATTKLAVGGVPRVVGTLSSLSPKCALAGDILEVRLDKMGQSADWLKRCVDLQSRGQPVLLTVRLRAEGGDWEADDEQRLAIYQQGLQELAAVDVELNSAISGEVAREASRRKKASVISFHDFEKTPPLRKLCAIVEREHAIGAIAKVSTMIKYPADVDILRALLRRRWEKPLCVIGMGRAWSKTRVEFAMLGSCLTYGYLEQSAAPGQLSASELVRRLRRVSKVN
jgi:3-dehydroquinate dehydratase-1